MLFSEPCDKIVQALFEAKKKMGPIFKDKTNPAFRSKYADLGTVLEAVEPALVDAGILALQDAVSDDDGQAVTVNTRLVHVESGQHIATALTLRPSKADPQGVGSAITYARRYAMVTLCGAAPEDDDGNKASAGTGVPKAQADRSTVAPVETLPAADDAILNQKKAIRNAIMTLCRQHNVDDAQRRKVGAKRGIFTLSELEKVSVEDLKGYMQDLREEVEVSV